MAAPPSAAARPDAGIRVHAVVPAAGRGERFGGSLPKQFQSVGDRPLLAWTLQRLLEAGCASIVVALPEEDLAAAEGRLGSRPGVRFVAGGATRQASVAEGLAASPAAAGDLVAVHDGARAAIDPGDFQAAVAAAAERGGAVLGRPSTDTLKEIEGGRILRTVDRSRLFRAETPQIFRRATLERALELARRDRFVGTDEAALVERLGEVDIAAVEARRPNPKVTFAEDLPSVAGLLLGHLRT
jgi:2-C-methyl-D-erythritol 4-phosphate cytidylyltransferase